MNSSPKGFALLVAVILTSVTLTIGLAILDVAYKQVTLATTAKQSQYAFYNAESVMECALYYDQKYNSFDFVTGNTTGAGMSCGGVVLTNVSASYSSTVPPPGTTRVTTFAKVCPAGTGISGNVSIYKNVSGATDIYASGFNSCNVAEPKRIERALKAKY